MVPFWYTTFPDPMSHAVDSAVDALRDELVGFLQTLVQTPSVSGDEAAAQRVVQAAYTAMGLAVERVVATREALASHPAFSDDGLPFSDERQHFGGVTICLIRTKVLIPPTFAAHVQGPYSSLQVRIAALLRQADPQSQCFKSRITLQECEILRQEKLPADPGRPHRGHAIQNIERPLLVAQCPEDLRFAR